MPASATAEQEALRGLLTEAEVAAHLIEPLALYGALLLDANHRFNLTGATSPDELLPHLLDSLTIVEYVVGPLVDIGSGGGLPAIPVAIATGAEVTLVESTVKKTAFLQTALRELGLAGSVVAGRAEEVGRDPTYRERFASATARAVSTTPTVMELVLPLLHVDGLAVLQRGALDERERRAAADAAPMLGGTLTDEIVLDSQRRILLVRKTAPTAQRFPRRTGIPEKRPLCL